MASRRGLYKKGKKSSNLDEIFKCADSLENVGDFKKAIKLYCRHGRLTENPSSYVRAAEISFLCGHDANWNIINEKYIDLTTKLINKALNLPRKQFGDDSYVEILTKRIQMQFQDEMHDGVLTCDPLVAFRENLVNFYSFAN